MKTGFHCSYHLAGYLSPPSLSVPYNLGDDGNMEGESITYCQHLRDINALRSFLFHIGLVMSITGFISRIIISILVLFSHVGHESFSDNVYNESIKSKCLMT